MNLLQMNRDGSWNDWLYILMYIPILIRKGYDHEKKKKYIYIIYTVV